MRVCERHPERKVNVILRNLQDGSEFDHCRECYDEFTKWLGERPVQKPAENKKEKKS